MANLGNFHLEGLGTPKDEAQAKKMSFPPSGVFSLHYAVTSQTQRPIFGPNQLESNMGVDATVGTKCIPDPCCTPHRNPPPYPESRACCVCEESQGVVSNFKGLKSGIPRSLSEAIDKGSAEAVANPKPATRISIHAGGFVCNRHLIFVRSDESDFRFQGISLERCQKWIYRSLWRGLSAV